MAESKAFTSMEGLLENLTKAMSQLKEGKLEVEALESITDDARDLYERLVVLRFQAYEKLQDKEGSSASSKDEFSFRIDSRDVLLENQTSLIDAIEEASKEPVKVEPPQKPQTSAPEIKFEETPVETIEDTKAKTVAPNDQEAEGLPAPKKEPDPKNEESKDKSLAAKLQKTPIEDLKKAISLNQKFQFISAFFGGNSNTYDKFITEVNQAKDLKEAKKIVTTTIGDRDEEDQVANMFMELVERRYQ
jgi:hypothetical protein